MVKAAFERAGEWLGAALGFIYPESCQLCGERRAGKARGFVCEECAGQAWFIEPPFCERCGLPYEGEITTAFECSNCRELDFDFCSARSAVRARGTVLEAIHRYKYHRALWLEPFLAELLVRKALPELAREPWDCIVPVPLHSVKHRQREFNQAERLARCLGRAAKLPVQSGWLRRSVATRTQTQLSRTARLENVRSAFAARAGAPLEGLRVVVVDDVLTTGATTSACAGALRQAGASEVCVWTVARGT